MLKQKVSEKEDVIREKQQFLESQVDNNKEQDKKINMAERLCAKTKMALTDAEYQKDQFREQASSALKIFLLTWLFDFFSNSFS